MQELAGKAGRRRCERGLKRRYCRVGTFETEQARVDAVGLGGGGVGAIGRRVGLEEGDEPEQDRHARHAELHATRHARGGEARGEMHGDCCEARGRDEQVEDQPQPVRAASVAANVTLKEQQHQAARPHQSTGRVADLEQRLADVGSPAHFVNPVGIQGEPRVAGDVQHTAGGLWQADRPGARGAAALDGLSPAPQGRCALQHQEDTEHEERQQREGRVHLGDADPGLARDASAVHEEGGRVEHGRSSRATWPCNFKGQTGPFFGARGQVLVFCKDIVNYNISEHFSRSCTKAALSADNDYVNI